MAKTGKTRGKARGPRRKPRAHLPALRRPANAAAAWQPVPRSDAPPIVWQEPREHEAVSPLDRLTRATVGRFTAGIAPSALGAAFFDWAVHLASSPGKQAFVMEKAGRKWTRFLHHMARCACTAGPVEPCIVPLPQDKRFAAPGWQKPPFNLIYQSFLLTQQWVYNATTDVHGVSRHHEDVVSFVARQMLDIASPSNFIPTNPEVLETTLRELGQNLVRGWTNLADDWERAALGKPPVGAEDFVPGKTVAITPGKVVYRNRLMELIQYAPKTRQVHAEPVLIVPAWIMKYYILDLSPENSLVKHLVDRGHTVFILSWKNPGATERDLGLEEYLRLGPQTALDVIARICPQRRVHGVGYCLGGTLLAIAASAMGRDGDERLKTLTLLAAQTDFEEAGELMLFIDDAQVSFLEDIMWTQGYLDTKQMAGAFQILRSNDLIWSRLVHDYLLGRRAPMNDLMAWNADATRMPFRMHSEYLRGLFLDNDLAEGRFAVDGRPVSLTDVRAPIFAVGTERDHVAPWRSAYKINQLVDVDVTFLLTSGGHNAGIVSPPGADRGHFRVATRRERERFVPPDEFLQRAALHKGSWWKCWFDWLGAHQDGRVPPPPTGGAGTDPRALDDAPGSYVLQP
ncbi:MAG: alpha/beta fold hydrolase [Alphaproteobacteria bacterium]|nr:alpha/beta fold hydrolase [Alphaproteobacteria bacterium]